MPIPLEQSLRAFDAISRRRSGRTYTPRKPDASITRRLLNAAVQAPAAMHMEPRVFVVIRDQATLQRLLDRAKTEASQRPWHVTADVASSAFPTLLVSLEFNIFCDASTLILRCAKPLSPLVVADCWPDDRRLCPKVSALAASAPPFPRSIVPTRNPNSTPADVEAVAPIIADTPRGPGSDAPRSRLRSFTGSRHVFGKRS